MPLPSLSQLVAASLVVSADAQASCMTTAGPLSTPGKARSECRTRHRTAVDRIDETQSGRRITIAERSGWGHRWQKGHSGGRKLQSGAGCRPRVRRAVRGRSVLAPARQQYRRAARLGHCAQDRCQPCLQLQQRRQPYHVRGVHGAFDARHAAAGQTAARQRRCGAGGW